jgi:hypothetical protein
MILDKNYLTKLVKESLQEGKRRSKRKVKEGASEGLPLDQNPTDNSAVAGNHDLTALITKAQAVVDGLTEYQDSGNEAMLKGVGILAKEFNDLLKPLIKPETKQQAAPTVPTNSIATN